MIELTSLAFCLNSF